MNILSIDPASTTGWAMSNEIYGTWDLKTLKDESIGMKLVRLRSKLNEVHKLSKLDLIVYERPAGVHKNPIIHQAKLIAIIETWCDDNGVEYRAYSSKEIKKFATGNGNCGKPAMIKAAKEKLAYVGNDDNETDALWLLNLVKTQLNI